MTHLETIRMNRFRYVIAMPPLDYWAGLVTLRTIVERASARYESEARSLRRANGSDLLRTVADLDTKEPYWDLIDDTVGLRETVQVVREACATLAASPLGWEGDARDLDHVGILLRPDDEATVIWGVVIKQGNNGTTFVVTDVPWPWPARDCPEWSPGPATAPLSAEAQWRKDRGYPDQGWASVHPQEAAPC
jgi:hypothetical protein